MRRPSDRDEPAVSPSQARRSKTPLRPERLRQGRYLSVAIWNIEHVRYVPPYKRTYIRFVGARASPHRKSPSRKGNSAPDVGLSSPTPRRHSVISPGLPLWDTRHDSPHTSGLSNTRPKSRARRIYRAELAASRESPWLKARATTRSAGGTGSACTKNIVGLRPPYFSAPTSGAEFPPGNRFWDTRHDSPESPGYRTGVPSRDPRLSLRDEMRMQETQTNRPHVSTEAGHVRTRFRIKWGS